MHTECLDQRAPALLAKLKKLVSTRGFILAGGTAAALHMGHRKSVDFDFFTAEQFSNDELIRNIKKFGLSPELFQEEKGTLTLSINGVKVSFFQYPYPFAEKPSSLSGIPVAGLIDIASMKVLAITQRGAKRDFTDLYFILQDVPFQKIASNMVKRFGKDRINPVIVGKALVYFEDAEADPDPEYLGRKKNWKEIKRYFIDHVRQIVLDLQKHTERDD